jgi:hypothetical protein
MKFNRRRAAVAMRRDSAHTPVGSPSWGFWPPLPCRALLASRTALAPPKWQRQTSVSVDRKVIELRNGYPDVSAGGIRNAVFDLDGFIIRSADNEIIFVKSDAPTSERCSVTYHAAVESADSAVVSGLDSSGC